MGTRGWMAVALAAAFAAGWAVTRTEAQEANPNDYRIVDQVPRQAADQWLKEHIERSGGRMDRQRYTFVIGFSTGHFGADPVHAIAMRRLAFSWLNNTFSPGDRVVPVAWEMEVWDFGSHVTLDSDPATRASFVNQVPYAPMQGTRGGHDVERVLYQVLDRLVRPQQASSTIILLLTNTNQSTSAPGTRLFGADNPALQSAIRRLGYRRPPVRGTFEMRSRGRTLHVDVTALFPTALRGRPGGGTEPRYPTFDRSTWQPAADMPAASEALPNPVAAPQSGDSGGTEREQPAAGTSGPGGSPAPWLVGLLLLVAAVAVAFWLLRRRPVTIAPPDQPAKPNAPPEQPAQRLPGTVKVVLGARTEERGELTAASRWVVAAAAGGSLVLADAGEDAPAQEAELAVLSFGPDRKLVVEARNGTQFTDIQPAGLPNADNAGFRLQPGQMAVCKVVPAGVGARTHMTVKYTVA